MNLRHRSWPFVAAVVLIALLAAWPAVSQPGLLNTRGGGDSPFLLQRLHQLVTAVADGHFPARWMPDANYGAGYPFYNFYAPLSIYIGAAFRFLGFSFVRSIHLAHIAGFLVAGVAMYALGRRWLGSRWAGVLAAAAYTLAPFHMVNVYVRGDSLAEFWAMAFYPLVLLAADGVLIAPPAHRPRRIALFALAYAALILSHNISALIFSPFLLLYLLLRWLWPQSTSTGATPESQRCWTSAVWPLAGLALAMALAAWFFVPALAEQDLAQLGPVTEGYFNYSNHFRGLDLIQPTPLFNYSPDGGTAFRMGLVQTVVATLGGFILFYTTIRKRPEAVARPERLVFIGLTALIATFMITPLSQPLWDHLPLLSFTQFPWRFLSVQALATALLTAGLAWPLGRAATVPLATLLLALSGLLGLRTDHLILTDADITAERLAQYEWFTGNIGTTVSAEYLPPGVVPRPYSSDWLTSGQRGRPVVLEGQLLSAKQLVKATDDQQWAFTTGEGGAVVLLPTLYWPEWTARADSLSYELAAQPGSGLMRLDLPPGEHLVDIQLEPTPVRRWSEWLSLLALIVTVVLLVARGHWRDVGRGLLVIGGATVVLAGGAWVLRQTDPAVLPSDDLTWDFAQMGYLHHDTAGVPFQDGSHLYSYGYSHDQIRSGETLTVTLSLDAANDAVATLDLATATLARPMPRDEAPPPLLVSTPLEPNQQPVVAALDIPADAPAGLYVPRLTLAGAQPLMPSGQTRGDLFLRPVRVLPADGPPTAAPLPAEPFLADVSADALFINDEGALEGHFTWQFNRPAGQNLRVSWRALDGAGNTLAQLDTQPGYGLNPTLGWPANLPVHDRLTLRLPETLSGPAPYPLVIILYDPADGRELTVRRLGQLVEEGGALAYRPIPPNFAAPTDISPLPLTLSETGRPLISLLGYTLSQSSDMLALTLHWQALADMPDDFMRFVHLIDVATGDIVAQTDSIPARDTYPTSQWVPQEVVADEVTFDLTALPPGTYQLATGFYRPNDGVRLDVSGPDGPLPDGRSVLPETVQLP